MNSRQLFLKMKSENITGRFEAELAFFIFNFCGCGGMGMGEDI